jgi:hypothetical protein
MSRIALNGNASGTGTVTIASPNTNSDRTVTLPDATGTLVLSGDAASFSSVSVSGNMSFNSGYGSAAVAYGCRAWVNFNGTSTVAIRASGNVTSITDNGTGDYTVNFTTAMPDANYSMNATGENASGTNYSVIQFNQNTSPTTSAVRLTSLWQSGGAPVVNDSARICVAIIR